MISLELGGPPYWPAPEPTQNIPSTAFGCRRDYRQNRYVYLVISPRARGLTIGLNLNPDKQCNFDCVYCEVDRRQPKPLERLDVDRLVRELAQTLDFVYSGEIRFHPLYQRVPEELLSLRDVVFSGDGEPTLCPEFPSVVRSVVQLREKRLFPYFKIVVLTNASGLERAQVQRSLRALTLADDQVWTKLDAGTEQFMARINGPTVSLPKVLENILTLGRQRPVVIQSLFLELEGRGPSPQEIDAYIGRLKYLITNGAKIQKVQVYSATRPSQRIRCRHLPLRELTCIAKLVQSRTELRTEVF